MKDLEMATLERAVEQARSQVQSSRSKLIEIDQALAMARSGGHPGWEVRLLEQRSEVEAVLEQASDGLSDDEDTLRKARAN